MARSETLCKGTKLFPQLLFKTLVSFIKDLNGGTPPPVRSRFLLKTRHSCSSVVSVSLVLRVVEALQAGFKGS